MEWISSWETFKLSIKKTWNLRKQVFWILLFQLILVVLSLFVIYWLSVAYDYAFESGLSFAVQLLLVFIIFLYQLIWNMSLIKMASQETPQTFNELASRFALRKLLPAFFVVILTLLAIALGTVLLVIPGVVISVYLLFSLITLTLEETSIINSLKQSKQLIKGYWWPMLGRLVFVILIISLVSTFAIVPVTGQTVAGILGFFLSPVIIVYFTISYQQLKSLKESGNVKSSMPVPAKLLMAIWAILVFIFFIVVNLFVDTVQNTSDINLQELIDSGEITASDLLIN